MYYFFAVSALIPLAKKDAFGTPSVETIRSESILGKAHQVSPRVIFLTLQWFYLYFLNLYN